MQASKGGGLAGGTFGTLGGGGSVFGGQGAGPFLVKVTTVLAVLFMLSSITHSLLSKQSLVTRSVVKEALEQQVPGTPGSLLPGLVGPDGVSSEETAPAESESPGEGEPPLEPADGNN